MGFEPTRRLSPPTRFPVAHLKPLGHLSKGGSKLRLRAWSCAASFARLRTSRGRGSRSRTSPRCSPTPRRAPRRCACSSSTRASLDPELVVGVEARGLILGGALAQELGVGFVPARKAGKLPAEKVSVEYELEYGIDALELHADAVWPGARVVLHDDLIATGRHGGGDGRGDRAARGRGRLLRVPGRARIPGRAGAARRPRRARADRFRELRATSRASRGSPRCPRCPGNGRPCRRGSASSGRSASTPRGRSPSTSSRSRSAPSPRRRWR